MSGLSAHVFNEAFMSKIATPDGQQKAAETGGVFVRDRLREVAFHRQIIPPVPVTRADCQVSLETDTLIKIVELEPESRAMTLTFRGQPRATYITGKRAAASFVTVSSELVMKNETELLAYEMPVTKVIEDNSVKDMEEIEDREWITHVEAGVQGLQQEANGGTVTSLNATGIAGSTVVEFAIRKGELARVAASDDATIRPLQKSDLVELMKILDGKRLKCAQFLLTEPDYDDQLQWTMEDVGSKLQSETTVDGYKYNTLLGKRVVRSIKTDILRRGNVYAFTESNFLGRSYILNSTKFYIDKVANTIVFQAWEDIAMLIVNVSSSAKIELYSGDATTNDSDGILSSVTPVDEEYLGAPNNRVSQGLVFPKIVPY